MKSIYSITSYVAGKTEGSRKVYSMVKEVPNIQNKGIKHYMAAELEPSEDIIGGHFYTDFIDACSKECVLEIHFHACDGYVWSGLKRVESSTLKSQENK